jgi:hypothetical protein
MVDRFPQYPSHPDLADRALERKDYLKIDAPVGGLGSTAPAAPTEKPTQRIRLIEQGRANRSNPRSEINIIKEIPGIGAEGKAEAPI